MAIPVSPGLLLDSTLRAVLNTPYRSPVLGPAPTQEPTAVATPAQGEVLAALSADGPATAAELGARTGQHPNTVREHLDALVDLGLAARDRDAPAGRGRPAYRYAALPHPRKAPPTARSSPRWSSTSSTDRVASHPDTHPPRRSPNAPPCWGEAFPSPSRWPSSRGRAVVPAAPAAPPRPAGGWPRRWPQ
ncbi:MAG: helix-turn-helix domain-containing protein [Actinomycetales bacterium]|uniref:Helix-turn-helix domain-containing protein n=1 Tax=Candidatus Phosphoribacter hodrii TaxID=2953743 RepID=A0A9D7TAR3_9MICO|nr:helix-turn-helix domain-containing protein [Candidatus Phosphoribacter hodrii]